MKVTIYQENNPTFRVDKEKKLYDKTEYHKVYEYESVAVEDNPEDFLETVFSLFNGVKPEGYNGHSLSVGDICGVREYYLYLC